MSTSRQDRSRCILRPGRLCAGRSLAALLAGALFNLVGCASDHGTLSRSSSPPTAPVESLVLRGDHLEPDLARDKDEASVELERVHELRRAGEFAKAERLYHKIAEGYYSGKKTFFGRLRDKSKVLPAVAEEARYYEAECLREQKRYPKAADTYHRMLVDFPNGAYRDQAVQHMFEIAHYWLDDTRLEMVLNKQKNDGERWVVWPNWFHPIDPTKPFFDEEGRALEKLEQVRFNDITGPLADKSLFLMGSVKFFRQDYKEADQNFSQLVELHPNSPYYTHAMKLAIVCKQLCTGGPSYDARKVVEARRLIDTALRSSPELAAKEGEFLNRQLYSITLQQAAKDYDVAEFYRRTGKPHSAYFYYEIVRRRYPGTKYFDLATERMHEIRAKAEQAKTEATPPPPPAPGAKVNVPQTSLPEEPVPIPRPLPAEMIQSR